MSWVWLLVAGLMEISWAVGMKYSHGFSRLWPSIFTVATMIASFFFLGIALKTLPLGTAYAVWTGIGTVGTAIFGMIKFGESAEFWRIFCLGLIVCGIVGLRLLALKS